LIESKLIIEHSHATAEKLKRIWLRYS